MGEASVVVDHVFLCTAVGAPAASKLIQFGLREGTPNRHLGQGTACRRFFFLNAMLELLWVEDAAEAQSEPTRRTRLWERWSAGGRGISPFGIVLRPAAQSSEIPFPAWEYRPKYLPDLGLQIATDTQPAEPMWCYLKAGRRPDDARPERRQPVEHPAGFREMTRLRICGPPLGGAAVTAAMARAGVVLWQAAADHLLELEFDGNQRGHRVDFHPDLPLAFRW